MSKDFLYDKANEVLGSVPPKADGTKSVGIEIIVALLQLLPTLYKCFKDHKVATQRVRNPTFFERLRLRRAVRQELGEAAYADHGRDVTQGILALGVDASEDDVKKFVQSCRD